MLAGTVSAPMNDGTPITATSDTFKSAALPND